MYLTTWKDLFTNKLLSGMLTLNSHSEKGCWKKGQNCMQQSQKVIWVSSNERILKSQTIRSINLSKLVTPGPYSEVFSDFPEILKLRTPALKTAHNTYWKSVACTFTLFLKTFLETPVYSKTGSVQWSPVTRRQGVQTLLTIWE